MASKTRYNKPEMNQYKAAMTSEKVSALQPDENGLQLKGLSVTLAANEKAKRADGHATRGSSAELTAGVSAGRHHSRSSASTSTKHYDATPTSTPAPRLHAESISVMHSKNVAASTAVRSTSPGGHMVTVNGQDILLTDAEYITNFGKRPSLEHSVLLDVTSPKRSQMIRPGSPSAAQVADLVQHFENFATLADPLKKLVQHSSPSPPPSPPTSPSPPLSLPTSPSHGIASTSRSTSPTPTPTLPPTSTYATTTDKHGKRRYTPGPPAVLDVTYVIPVKGLKVADSRQYPLERFPRVLDPCTYASAWQEDGPMAFFTPQDGPSYAIYIAAYHKASGKAVALYHRTDTPTPGTWWYNGVDSPFPSAREVLALETGAQKAAEVRHMTSHESALLNHALKFFCSKIKSSTFVAPPMQETALPTTPPRVRTHASEQGSGGQAPHHGSNHTAPPPPPAQPPAHPSNNPPPASNGNGQSGAGAGGSAGGDGGNNNNNDNNNDDGNGNGGDKRDKNKRKKRRGSSSGSSSPSSPSSSSTSHSSHSHSDHAGHKRHHHHHHHHHHYSSDTSTPPHKRAHGSNHHHRRPGKCSVQLKNPETFYGATDANIPNVQDWYEDLCQWAYESGRRLSSALYTWTGGKARTWMRRFCKDHPDHSSKLVAEKFLEHFIPHKWEKKADALKILHDGKLKQMGNESVKDFYVRFCEVLAEAGEQTDKEVAESHCLWFQAGLLDYLKKQANNDNEGRPFTNLRKLVKHLTTKERNAKANKEINEQNQLARAAAAYTKQKHQHNNQNTQPYNGNNQNRQPYNNNNNNNNNNYNNNNRNNSNRNNGQYNRQPHNQDRSYNGNQGNQQSKQDRAQYCKPNDSRDVPNAKQCRGQNTYKTFLYSCTSTTIITNTTHITHDHCVPTRA